MKKNSYLVKKRFLVHDAMVTESPHRGTACARNCALRYVSFALPLKSLLTYLLDNSILILHTGTGMVFV